MRLLVFLLFGLLAWSCVNQAEAGPRRKPRMVGGTPSAPNRWPFMAAVFKDIPGECKCKFACGAVVWDERTIVTAASCSLAANLEDLRVYPGQPNVTELDAENLFEVEKVMIQEDFDAISGNIALLRLKKALDFSSGLIQPVGRSLPEDKVDTRDCVSMGWGDIGDFNFEIKDILHEVSLNLLPDEKCAEKWGLTQLPPGLKCAFDEKESSGVCIGDWGSPIMCRLKSDPSQYSMMGVAVAGDSRFCTLGLVTKPSLFTSMQLYQPWIEKTVASHEYNSPISHKLRLRHLLTRMIFLAKAKKAQLTN